MRIYRQNVVKDGQTITVRKWYLDARFSGKRYRLPLFEDRRASEDFAAMFGIMAGQYDSGRSYDKRIELWLNQIHPNFLKKFCQWGLLEKSRAESGRDLIAHLDEYQNFLRHKGDSAKHVAKVGYRVRAIADGCGFSRLSDVSESKSQHFIYDQVDAGRMSQATGNYYLRAFKSFTAWMYRTDRIDRDPLKNLSLRKVASRKKNRRALSVTEIKALLEWTSCSSMAFGMSGLERMIVYKLALTTGLRAAEIRCLTCRSIDVRNKSVHVPGAYTKSRQAATLPLRDDVLDDIMTLKRGKRLSDPLFAALTFKTADMVRGDLAGARAAYEAEGGTDGDFLQAETADGEIDFHALRHSYATLLVNGGTDVKTAQSLLRHSSPMLTLGIYSHVLRESEQSAVNGLPSFEVKQSKAKKA